MKRKLISLVAVLALALSLTACGGGDTSTPSGSGDGGSTQAVSLAYAFMGAEDTMLGRWATSFKEKVEAASEGGITVTLYPNGELGSDSETIESLLDNTLQIVGTQPSPAVPFVPELAIFDLPCAFATADAETINTVLNDSDFATQLDGYFAEANLKCLGFSQGATFREFSSNTKITDLADFNGLKMRVMDNAYQIQFWDLMGCSTTPVPGSELYMSLQNGLVEAQENALDTIIAGSMHEVQDYITMTNHSLYTNMMLMNQEYFSSLPQEYQDIIETAVAETITEMTPLYIEADEESRATLEEAGLEFTDLTDEQFAQIREIAQPVYDDVSEAIGSEVVDGLMAALA